MRRAVSILLIGLIAIAWANVLTAGSTLPPCCKAHHCSMKKQCAISTCDAPSASTVSAKTFTILCDVLKVTPRQLSFDAIALDAAAPPLAPSSDIDHPPRLLLV